MTEVPVLESNLSLWTDEDIRNRMPEDLYAAFWKKCKDVYWKDLEDTAQLDEYLQKSSKVFLSMQVQMSEYCKEMRKLPIASVLGLWIKSLATDRGSGRGYITGITKILEKNLICLSDNGKNRTFEYFDFLEHLATIENIRCVKEWTYSEKEDYIRSYLQFSKYLSQFTFNIFPNAYDPDRRRVENKVLKYENFMEFVHHLSDRDALISKLLYFGAPSIEAVISLKRDMVHFHNQAILFNENSSVFPKHLMLGIQEYVNSRKDSSHLLFVNVRGEPVERTHLINTFSRVSAKMSGDVKISPSTLMKFKSES